MKTRLFVTAILALSLGLFTSCDTTEEITGGSSNYWSSNALTRMQLHGSVHTMTLIVATAMNADETVSTFNTDGNLTSTVSGGTSYSNSSTFTYENGKLVSETNTYSSIYDIQKRSTTTTTYQYENTGKFVPKGPFHFYEMGLVPALSAVINDNSRMDFVFHGTDLWIVNTYENVPMDTSIVQYTGNYPSSTTTEWSYCNNMTYAANGMFLTYSEGFYGPGYDDNRTYTFTPNDTYLLVDRMVNTYVSGEMNNVSTTNYTYNDHFDKTGESSDNSTYQWYDYVYDATGNWTSRKYRYSTGEDTWSEPITDTRSFTYY